MGCCLLLHSDRQSVSSLPGNEGHLALQSTQEQLGLCRIDRRIAPLVDVVHSCKYSQPVVASACHAFGGSVGTGRCGLDRSSILERITPFKSADDLADLAH